MKYMIAQCDGCGVDLTKKPYYHKFTLTYRTYINDPNTKQEEEMTNMSRDTESCYCDKCFMIYLDHMDNFIKDMEKLDPAFNTDKYEIDINSETQEIQSKEPDSGGK